jgi:hypothetical protein
MRQAYSVLAMSFTVVGALGECPMDISQDSKH